MSFTKTKDKSIISSLCYIVIIIVFALVLLTWLFGRTFIERDTILKMNYQTERIKVTRVYTPFDKTILNICINGDNHIVPTASIPEGFSFDQDKFIIIFYSNSKDSVDSLSFDLH